MNNVCLIGRLTKNPDLRTTATGKSVCSFSLAVNKRIKPTDGSPDADFFNFVAWGAQAEYVTNYLTKGRMVSIEGRLQSRRYTDSAGTTRDVVEIVVNNVQSLDRPREDGESQARPRASQTASAVDEYDPFADE